MKLYHSTHPITIVLNVVSSKRKIQTLSTVSNVSEFEMEKNTMNEVEYCGDFVRYYCGICLEENCIFYPCKHIDVLLNHIRKNHKKKYN